MPEPPNHVAGKQRQWKLRGAHSAFDSNPELCVAGPSIELAEWIEVCPLSRATQAEERVEELEEALEVERHAMHDAAKFAEDAAKAILEGRLRSVGYGGRNALDRSP